MSEYIQVSQQGDEDIQSLTYSLKKDKKPLKRIASLDFLRGLALFSMITYHSLMGVYDYSFLEDFETLLEINIIIVVILGICAFFGTWHGFFLFISSIVNSYAVFKKLSRNENAKPIILKQFFMGIVLIINGWLEQALGYYGIIGSLISTGTYTGGFSKFIWSLYRIETLQIIGFCLIINTLILYLFSKNDGLKKHSRNMIILACMIVGTIVFTFFMRKWIPNLNWLYPDGGSILDLSSITISTGTFPAWLISISFANLLPIFPFIATSFAGTMIGLTLANPGKVRLAPLYGILIGLLSMSTGVILIAVGSPWSTIEINTEVSTYLLRFGGQIIFIWAFLYFIEYRGRGDKFANRHFVKFIRRWGVLSLTLYCMKIFEYIPRLIMQLLFGTISGKNFMKSKIYGNGEELGLIFAVILIVSMYHLVLVVWEKVNYIGSLEWTISKVQSKLLTTDMKQIVDLLDSEKIYWVNFIPVKREALSIENLSSGSAEEQSA